MLFLDDYTFKEPLFIGEDESQRKNEEVKATFCHYINDKLLNATEIMVSNQIKERLLCLLELDKDILYQQENMEAYLREQYFFGPNVLLDYLEEHADESVIDRFRKILFFPWETGDMQVLEAYCEDEGRLKAVFIVYGLYYAFTDSSRVDLNLIRSKSDINNIESIALNYVIHELMQPSPSITPEDVEELIEELQVAGNIKRG